MTKKQEATKIIALTLAHVRRLETPGITEWGQAKILANTFEAAGHIQPEVEVGVSTEVKITTVEELDALPDFSIVSRNSVPYVKHYGRWYLPASETDFTARSLLLNDNATLIHKAEESE